jgi:hypothetical protein
VGLMPSCLISGTGAVTAGIPEQRYSNIHWCCEVLLTMIVVSCLRSYKLASKTHGVIPASIGIIVVTQLRRMSSWWMELRFRWVAHMSITPT